MSLNSGQAMAKPQASSSSLEGAPNQQEMAIVAAHATLAAPASVSPPAAAGPVMVRPPVIPNATAAQAHNLDTIPVELQIEIFKYLSPEESVVVGLLCKTLNSAHKPNYRKLAIEAGYTPKVVFGYLNDIDSQDRIMAYTFGYYRYHFHNIFNRIVSRRVEQKFIANGPAKLHVLIQDWMLGANLVWGGYFDLKFITKERFAIEMDIQEELFVEAREKHEATRVLLGTCHDHSSAFSKLGRELIEEIHSPWKYEAACLFMARENSGKLFDACVRKTGPPDPQVVATLQNQILLEAEASGSEFSTPSLRYARLCATHAKREAAKLAAEKGIGKGRKRKARLGSSMKGRLRSIKK